MDISKEESKTIAECLGQLSSIKEEKLSGDKQLQCIIEMKCRKAIEEATNLDSLWSTIIKFNDLDNTLYYTSSEKLGKLYEKLRKDTGLNISSYYNCKCPDDNGDGSPFYCDCDPVGITVDWSNQRKY